MLFEKSLATQEMNPARLQTRKAGFGTSSGWDDFPMFTEMDCKVGQSDWQRSKPVTVVAKESWQRMVKSINGSV